MCAPTISSPSARRICAPCPSPNAASIWKRFSPAAGDDAAAVEGCMIKRADSPYVPGRPKGLWWKWKFDPHIIDAVLMYAQRGHGKRSSFYSDFTFGVWREVAGAPE